VELQPGRNTLTWKPLGTYETGRKNNLHVRFDSPAQINRLLRGETLVSKREYEMNPDFSLQLQIDGDSPVALDLEFRGRLVRPSKELALEQYPLEIQHLDAQVGRLRDFLSERDLSDKTLWIGVSDHGEGLYDHGHLGHAGAVFEAQLRVAWFMAGPGLPEQTVISEVLSRTEDVYPTLREFLGLVPAADVDGVSKVGCFSGGTCSRSRNTGSYAIAAGGKLTSIAVVEWPYKRLWILDRGVEVHALDTDPLEQRNLLESKEPQPAELRDLEAELHSFYLRLEDALAGRPAQTLDEEQERALKSLGYL
jgi:arylsulfatase A-like enzyme